MRRRFLRFVLEVAFRPWPRRKTTRMEARPIQAGHYYYCYFVAYCYFFSHRAAACLLFFMAHFGGHMAKWSKIAAQPPKNWKNEYTGCRAFFYQQTHPTKGNVNLQVWLGHQSGGLYPHDQLYPHRCGRQTPATKLRQKQRTSSVLFARTFAKNPSHPVPMWVDPHCRSS